MYPFRVTVFGDHPSKKAPEITVVNNQEDHIRLLKRINQDFPPPYIKRHIEKIKQEK